jgi:hypothetical protein
VVAVVVAGGVAVVFFFIFVARVLLLVDSRGSGESAADMVRSANGVSKEAVVVKGDWAR